MNKYLSTEQLAELFKVKPATLRSSAFLKGHYCDIRPIKLPNRFLAWPLDQAPPLIQAFIQAQLDEHFEQGFLSLKSPEKRKPKPDH